MNTFTRLEQYLLPPPEMVRWHQGQLTIETCTTAQKVLHCTKNVIAFTGLLLLSPLTLTYDWFQQNKEVPLRKTPNIERACPPFPPKKRGYAMSFFQTSGLGTKWGAGPEFSGKNEWDKWMDQPGHILHPNQDYKQFFTDILSDPTAYIQMLKEQNVTAHRFSLEWSIIEPEPGKIDAAAVALYQSFIHKLLDANIKPSVTLNHFTVPQWFHERGGFQNIENIDCYVRFAIGAMNLFPNVKNFWSFNEVGIKSYQQAREVFPTNLPEGSSLAKRVHAAGIATRNMLIAHCKLYREVRRLHPTKKLGITHQWLKFDTATGNCLERFFAYMLTKFGFTPVYQFLRKGKFAFQFPFMANIQFDIPEEEFLTNQGFLDALGVQTYPKPFIKMGLNHGEAYPGRPGAIQNLPFFSFGATCEPGGTVMWFGPRWKAEDIDETFDEAFAVTEKVYVTEFGSDAHVQRWRDRFFRYDDAAQAKYLQQLTERIQNYSAKTFRKIKGIFCWSDLRRQMEWNEGHYCRLALIEPVVDAQRRLTGWLPTPASRYLANVYRERH